MDRHLALAGELPLRIYGARRRLDGTPAWGHAVRVAAILADENLPPWLCLAGALHDALEDRLMARAALEALDVELDRPVSAVVRRLTRPGLPLQCRRDTLYHIRLLAPGPFRAAALAVKAADTVDNLARLGVHPPGRARRKLREADRFLRPALETALGEDHPLALRLRLAIQRATETVHHETGGDGMVKVQVLPQVEVLRELEDAAVRGGETVLLAEEVLDRLEELGAWRESARRFEARRRTLEYDHD